MANAYYGVDFFREWSGDASGRVYVTALQMDQDKSVTAHFGKATLRVDATSTASNPDGSSWEKAFQNLQAAVDAAEAGGEVWVAQGTYRDTTDFVVSMKEGVLLYGGFVGNERALTQRDWKSNVTIIDGEDARCCVKGANNARLDGFTVTRGYTVGYGGGMHNSSSSPVITNCCFTLNNAGQNGGGIYNSHSLSVITNCCFTLNNTPGFHGGAMYNYSSSPRVTNCLFTLNSAGAHGGGIYNIYSGARVTNCCFVSNSAYYHGGGMYTNDNCSTTVTNCIIWRNYIRWEDSSSQIVGPSTISYSCIQGGYSGTGNISADPLFRDAPYSLQLRPGSPCLDSGTAVDAPTTDILGRSRPQGPGVDMGAYEGAVAEEDQCTLTIALYPDYLGETDPPAGSHVFGRGETVMVVANAYHDTNPFTGWSGDASGTDSLIHIEMGQDKSVTAHFKKTIFYVDVARPVIYPDGSSWLKAFNKLQPAVDAAAAAGGGEVWVARGMYTDTTDQVVTMKEGVFLYGGFVGNESLLEERDWQANVTTIDGEGERRCVVGADNARLDGFTIARGFATEFGGGMYNNDSSPVIANCNLTSNNANYNGDVL